MPGFERQYGGEAHDIPQSGANGGGSQKTGKSSKSVSKQLNRFSSFVKAGGENYLLGKANASVRKSDQVGRSSSRLHVIVMGL